MIVSYLIMSLMEFFFVVFHSFFFLNGFRMDEVNIRNKLAEVSAQRGRRFLL